MYTAVSLFGSELLYKVITKWHLSGRLIDYWFYFSYLFNDASTSDCIALNGIVKQGIVNWKGYGRKQL
jgi:hypothetical protein